MHRTQQRSRDGFGADTGVARTIATALTVMPTAKTVTPPIEPIMGQLETYLPNATGESLRGVRMRLIAETAQSDCSPNPTES